MRILVTGGAGFLGSHTIIELLNEDYNVVVIDNLCNSSIEALKRIDKLTNCNGELFSFITMPLILEVSML